MAQTPTILLVRHGETDLNREKRVRGWADVDLSEKGRADTLKTAQSLNGLQVSRIYTSDLGRAEQTAEVLANQLFVPVQPTRALRDWNYGEYTGMKLDEVRSQLEDLVDNPRKKAPGGESFGAFENRWKDGLHGLVQDALQNGIVVAVTHSRNIAVTESWLKGERNAKDMIQAASVPPSGVMALQVKDGRLVQMPFDNQHLERDV